MNKYSECVKNCKYDFECEKQCEQYKDFLNIWRDMTKPNTITQPKLNNTQFNITQFNNEQFVIRPIINDIYPYPIHVLDLMAYRI